MVNAWNVGELDQMVLPPCHYGFQVYTRELSHKERCDLFGHNDSLDRVRDIFLLYLLISVNFSVS
jgi:thymidylate synthase